SLLAAAACSAGSGPKSEVNAQGGSSNGGAGGSGGFINTGGSDAGVERETVDIIGPGADADAPNKFGGEPVAAAPEVVYPESGVVVPPNMNSLELHFLPGPGQTLFELTFQAEKIELIVYVGCNPLGAGCLYQPDQTFWEQ